jgi:hypothetical protein
MATEEAAEHYAKQIEDYTKTALQILKEEGEPTFLAKVKKYDGHPVLKDKFPKSPTP